MCRSLTQRRHVQLNLVKGRAKRVRRDLWRAQCRPHTSLCLYTDILWVFFFFWIGEVPLHQIPVSHSQTCQHGAPPGSVKPLACFQWARIEYINKDTYSWSSSTQNVSISMKLIHHTNSTLLYALTSCNYSDQQRVGRHGRIPCWTAVWGWDWFLLLMRVCGKIFYPAVCRDKAKNSHLRSFGCWRKKQPYFSLVD